MTVAGDRSNTTADHVEVLDQALASLPAEARPGPGGPTIVVRADAAGATHGFAAACRARGVGFSFGFPITEDVRAAIKTLPRTVWAPAVDPDDDIRDGAWVAELTGLLDLTAWPAGSRVIVTRHSHGTTLPPRAWDHLVPCRAGCL